MIETSITVGNYLENLAGNTHDGFPQNLSIDFTPGAQGIWKAFELEVNLSMIQAAREARGITMPTYFTLYDPTFSPEQGIVRTQSIGNQKPQRVFGQNPTTANSLARPIQKENKVFTVDINQLDWSNRSNGRHRFISLGNALYLVKTMTNSPQERLDFIVQKNLGKSLPDSVINAWEQIIRIRNQGSHVRPLNQRNYEQILQSALTPDVLGPLLKIKSALLKTPN